jgi:hypothetical protein
MQFTLDLALRTDSGTGTVEVPAALPLPTVESNGSDGAILFQSTPGTSPSSITTDPDELISWFSQGIHELMSASSKRTLDVLFGAVQRLGEITLQPMSLPQDVSSSDENVDYEDPTIRLLRTEAAPQAAQPVAVRGLLVLASLAAATSAEYHRSKLKRQRNPQHWRNATDPKQS